MILTLTQEMLNLYLRGQIEIKKEGIDPYLFHGEIKKATLEQGIIWLTFHWMAEAVNYPSHPLSNPLEWIAAERSLFTLVLNNYEVDYDEENHNILLRPESDSHSITFFLPEDQKNKLDPSVVKYLTIIDLDD